MKNQHKNINDICLHICHLYWQELADVFQTLEQEDVFKGSSNAKHEMIVEAISEMRNLLR